MVRKSVVLAIGLLLAAGSAAHAQAPKPPAPAAAPAPGDDDDMGYSVDDYLYCKAAFEADAKLPDTKPKMAADLQEMANNALASVALGSDLNAAEIKTANAEAQADFAKRVQDTDPRMRAIFISGEVLDCVEEGFGDAP